MITNGIQFIIKKNQVSNVFVRMKNCIMVLTGKDDRNVDNLKNKYIEICPHGYKNETS